jgi:hypothetical protein
MPKSQLMQKARSFSKELDDGTAAQSKFSANITPVLQSHFFETMSEATRAGKAALAELRANRAA